MKQVALLSLLEENQEGAVRRSSLGNRLAPFLFAPRLQRWIVIPETGLIGVQVILPMEARHWHNLPPLMKTRLLEQTDRLCGDFPVQVAVSRRLNQEAALSVGGTAGSGFIISMTLLKLTDRLADAEARRIILASDHSFCLELTPFLSERFGLPLMLQSRTPARQEAAALRLLYDEGIPLSLGLFDPEKWRKDDIILAFDEPYAYWGSRYGRGIQMNLGENSSGHAPLLELRLAASGVAPFLHNLAPLMEAAILADGDEKTAGRGLVEMIEAKGQDLWYYFLDNTGQSHYNSLKGF